MSRAKRRQPLRQPRGPRATLPPAPPRPEKPDYLGWVLGDACEDCGHWNDECTCEAEQ